MLPDDCTSDNSPCDNPMPRKPKPDDTPKLTHDERRAIRDAILDRVRAGETISSLAESTGYTDSYIRLITRQAGLKARSWPRKRHTRERTEATNTIVEALAASNEPLNQIARRFGVSRQHVHNLYERARRERKDIPERTNRGVRPENLRNRIRISDKRADPVKVRFAREFAGARQAKGLSQSALGTMIGANQHIVRVIEMYGDRPPDKILEAATQALGIDLSSIAPPIPENRTGSLPATMQDPPDPDPYSVGDMVRRLRIANGMTQEALGSAMVPPASPSQITQIESGRYDPLPETVGRLAKALGVDRSIIDVKVPPVRSVNLVREMPHGRWVGMTDGDKGVVNELLGKAERPNGMGSGTVAALVEKAGDERVAVIVRGDLGVKGAEGLGEWVRIGKTRGK